MDKRLRRVLILDTDPDTLMALQHVLEGAEVDCTVTWDEAEACQLLGKADFNLILIGDHPPELDPAAVLHQLRTRAAFAPALILTASTGGKEADYGRLGAVSVIQRQDPLAVLEEVKKTLATQLEENSGKARFKTPAVLAA
jgi:CheY-like chemotaxis protein